MSASCAASWLLGMSIVAAGTDGCGGLAAQCMAATAAEPHGAVLPHRPSFQIRAGFQQALELVAGEAAGEAGPLPAAGPVAEAVEAALYTEFGELNLE